MAGRGEQQQQQQQQQQQEGDAETHDDSAIEQQPLLASGRSNNFVLQVSQELQQLHVAKAAAAADTAQQQEQQQRESGSSKAAVAADKQQDSGQCRICLEEDSLSSLEAPCGCAGTQRYAHRDCIQKWVNEKHHTTCEVCAQPYKGTYIVPPLPPPPPVHLQGEPLHAAAPLGSLYLTVEDDRLAGQLLGDVYDDWDDHRQPTVSWCFSFMMFLLFMMFLHSTMTLSVPTDPAAGGAAAGGGMGPGVSPAVDPASDAGGAGGMPAGGAAAAAAGFAAGASVFLLWLLTKLFLVVLPLLMVMRLTARAQEQSAEAEAAAAAVGRVPGLDGPEPAAAANGGGFLARFASGSAGRAASSHSRGSSLTDLELEVLQARRAALTRTGRAATLWGPAAGMPAAGTEVRVPGSTGEGAAGQQQDAAAAEQRIMAAVRAMVRAAVLSATQRELARQQAGAGQGGEEAGAAAAQGPAARVTAGSDRLSNVV